MGVVHIEGDNGVSANVTQQGELVVTLSSSGNALDINPDGSINSVIKDDSGAGVIFQSGKIPVVVSSSIGNEVTSQQKNTVFSVHNSYGLSDKRNIYFSTGAPVYSVTGSEIKVEITGASDRLIIETNQVGTPVQGLIYEASISIRMPDTFSGSQKTEWGYFDNNEGFYFGKDSGGIYVAMRRNGAEENKVYQSGWSVDKLDGSGASLLTLSTASGASYYIQTNCSEYGTIYFYVELNNGANGQERAILVHRMNPSSPVINNHNKPVTVTVFASSNTTYIGGRSFSVYGDYKPLKREVQNSRLNFGGLSTSIIPAFIVRRKSGFEDVPIKFSNLTILPDIDVLVEVYKNATFTSTGAFSSPLNFTSSETACEITQLITGFSGGQKQFGFICNKDGLDKPIDINFDRDSHYVVCIRRVAGNGGQASIQLSWEEYW